MIYRPSSGAKIKINAANPEKGLAARVFGIPDWSRTNGLSLRRRPLYPTELPGHIQKLFNFPPLQETNELPLRKRLLYPLSYWSRCGIPAARHLVYHNPLLFAIGSVKFHSAVSSGGVYPSGYSNAPIFRNRSICRAWYSSISSPFILLMVVSFFRAMMVSSPKICTAL